METLQNNFKIQFKYYKRKQPPPSFDEVLNVRNAEQCIYFSETLPKKYFATEVVDINSPSKWRIFSSKTNPGFHVITNAMSVEHQMTWARRSLETYSSKTSKRNIDLPGSRLDVDDWYEDVLRRPDYIDKLRWSTLGYHHDWDTKVYSESKSVFPPELFNLCALIANVIGYPDFKAQAAIVNFYPMSGTLSSHTDHSELNTEHPIVSISLGQSAIFLLGGTTLDVKPTSFLLQSGDIVVMEKDARLAYHAVPRIVKSDVEWKQKVLSKISLNEPDVMAKTSLNEPDVMAKTSLNESRVTSKTSLNKPKVMSKITFNEPELVSRTAGGSLNEPEVLFKIPTTEVTGEHFDNTCEKELFSVKYLSCHRININARQVH